MEPNSESVKVLYDMEDPEFWSEYEKFMREPMNDEGTLVAIKGFVEGEEDAR